MPHLGELVRSTAETGKVHAFAELAWLVARHPTRLRDALAEAEGSRAFPEAIAVLKAGVAAGTLSDASWASPIAELRSLSSAFLTTLVGATVLSRLQSMSVPFAQRIAIETVPVRGGWCGGSRPLPASGAGWRTTAELAPKVFGVLVPLSADLMRVWSPQAGEAVRQAIARSVIYASDAALLDPNLAETDLGPGSLLHDVVPIESSGATADAVTLDLSNLLASLSNTDFSRVLIVMAPASALFLATLKDANGARAFPDLNLVSGGEIWGVPVAISRSAASTGSPNESFVAALDGAGILVAQDPQIAMDASSAAALQLDDAPSAGASSQVSMFQTNGVALRVLRTLNFKAVEGSVAWMKVGF